MSISTERAKEIMYSVLDATAENFYIKNVSIECPAVEKLRSIWEEHKPYREYEPGPRKTITVELRRR